MDPRFIETHVEVSADREPQHVILVEGVAQDVRARGEHRRVARLVRPLSVRKVDERVPDSDVELALGRSPRLQYVDLGAHHERAVDRTVDERARRVSAALVNLPLLPCDLLGDRRSTFERLSQDSARAGLRRFGLRVLRGCVLAQDEEASRDRAAARHRAAALRRLARRMRNVATYEARAERRHSPQSSERTREVSTVQ